MARSIKSPMFAVLTITCLFPVARCSSAVDSEAQKVLLNKIGKTSVTIYPTCIRGSEKTYDHVSIYAIKSFLGEKKLAESQISSHEIVIAVESGMSQSKMFRQSAKKFGDYVSRHPISTEYVLMAEYLMGRREAVGIHCYIVDAQGRLAGAVGLNSHHKVFSDASPKTAEDCTKILLTALNDELIKR